jgi:hypothetical protein
MIVQLAGYAQYGMDEIFIVERQAAGDIVLNTSPTPAACR